MILPIVWKKFLLISQWVSCPPKRNSAGSATRRFLKRTPLLFYITQNSVPSSARKGTCIPLIFK